MAAKKSHNRTDRNAHLARVSDLRSQGLSMREIATLTNRSHGQICKDLKACDDLYRDAIADKREEFHRTALMGHEQLLKTAWKSFRESKKLIREVRDPDTGETVVKTQDDVYPGDPRFLKIGLDAWKGLRDLMGLDEPTQTENSTTVTIVREDDELTDDDLERIIVGDYTEQEDGLCLSSGKLVPFSTLRQNGTNTVHGMDVPSLRNGTASGSHS